jgi:predicted  nucleic acid-binding Zn-ribbon protein
MAKVKDINEKYLELAGKNIELTDRIAKMKHQFDYTMNLSEVAYAKLEKKYNQLNKSFGELEEENLVLRTALKVTL